MFLIAGLKTDRTHLFNPVPAGPAEEPYAALCGAQLAPKIQVRPYYPAQVMQDVTCDTCRVRGLERFNPMDDNLKAPPKFWPNAHKDAKPVQGTLF
jgi:hypothetical protein